MPRSTEIVGEKTNSTGLIIHRIIAYVVLVLLVVVSLFPFYLLIINATRGRSQAGIRWYPDHFLATNFKNLFSGSTAVAYGSVWRSLANSLFISACASLLSVYFSALTAYATHVYQFKLRKFADMFILIVMMVPTQASAIGFYQFMNKLGWTDTYIPLIIPAVAAPATYYFMKQYMASALPLEIVEAARIDGCGEFKTFNKIVTPILKPAFAVQIIFTFVTNWNNYFMPRLILTSKSKYTIPLVLNAMRYAGPQEKDVGMFSKLGWTDTYIPLIIPAVAAPATYYFMKQYMASALPLEIVEAARIDGCGEFKTFNKIVTPILKPAFAVQIIFTFVTNWNNYFMPRLILTSKSKYTIPLVLNAMRYAGPQEKDVGMFSLYIVLAILPVVIVYLCLSKFIIRGVALGSVKG